MHYVFSGEQLHAEHEHNSLKSFCHSQVRIVVHTFLSGLQQLFLPASDPAAFRIKALINLLDATRDS